MSGLRKGRVLFLLQILLKYCWFEPSRVPLVWGSHISGFPLSECPSAHSCLTSVSVLSCFASSLHLFQLFRCYLGIVTGWNNASSCFGCFMASFVITLCNQQGFFFFFTSEWQVKAKGLLVWWLNESLCIFFKPFPLHVVINRKQAEVGPPDDRGEVRGSQGALGLQEQQQTERKPPSASQRQERPQRSVYDVIALLCITVSQSDAACVQVSFCRWRL